MVGMRQIELRVKQAFAFREGVDTVSESMQLFIIEIPRAENRGSSTLGRNQGPAMLHHPVPKLKL